jgi:DNA-binding FadR family transcriptional regulator
MERTGLVAHIEQDLERVISLGRLPRNGLLPSEQVIARSYGVSRATAREVLLRLAVRGLVVQHPGRRSRALPLQEAVTLENLSVALHAEGPAHPERRRLLEGFFELRREMTVELLAACCEHASETDLNRLLDVCFQLEQKAPWEEKGVRAKREFELLRLAALAANRPGHFLLIQTLERSFWGMAGRVLPHLDSEAVSRWAHCAFHALRERAAQALRRELPALLQVADERLCGPLASHREEVNTPVDVLSSKQSPESTSDSEPERERLPGAVRPDRSGCQTGSHEVQPAGAPLVASLAFNLSDCQTGSGQARPAREFPPASAPGRLPDALCPNRSGCQTGSRPMPPAGPLLSVPSLTRSGGTTKCRGLETGEPAGLAGVWRAHAWSPVPWGLRPQLPLQPPITDAADVFCDGLEEEVLPLRRWSGLRPC